VTFTQGATTVHRRRISRPTQHKPAFITKNYLSNAFGLSNDAVTVQARSSTKRVPTHRHQRLGHVILNNGSTTTSTRAVAEVYVRAGLSGALVRNIVIGAGANRSPSIFRAQLELHDQYDVTNQSGRTGQFSPGIAPTRATKTAHELERRPEQRPLLDDDHQHEQVLVPNQMSSGAISIVHITLSVQPIISFPNTQRTASAYGHVTLDARVCAFAKREIQRGMPAAGTAAAPYSIAGRSLTASDISLEAASPAPCSLIQRHVAHVGNGTNTLAAVR